MVLLLTDDRLESVSFISYVRIEDRHFPLVTEIDLQTIGHVPAHVSPHSETRIAHVEPILAPVRSISIFALIAPSIFGTYETGVSVCAVRDRSSSGWAEAAPAASSSNKPPIVFFIFLSFSLVYDRAKRSVPRSSEQNYRLTRTPQIRF